MAADIDFSQAFTYSDINKVYLMAVELSGGLVTQHGSVQLESIFQDSTLYAQVSALKTEMESILQNFTGASEYDDTATYAVGDYCTRNDYLYQCNTPVSAESWDASKWDVVTISSQYSEVYTMLTNILGVDDYSTSASYAVGDLVVHDGKLYRCTTAVSSEAWDDGKWSETSFVAESESIITEIRTEGDAQVAAVQSVYAEDLAEINARVSRNTKEIANLIQKEGVVSVSYPDSIYGRGEVPSGMAKYAEVSCLRGVSRVANNLCGSPNLRVMGYYSYDSATATFTLNVTMSSNDKIWVDKLVNNLPHVYLVYATNPTVKVYMDTSSVGNAILYDKPSGSNGYFGIYFESGRTYSNVQTKIVCIDLTTYFGPDPSVDVSSLTIADIQQKYPELLVPSAYDTGSPVDTTYGAVDSEGVNLWDEEWEQGYYDQSTGLPVSNTSRIRSKNFISVSYGSTYYALIPSATISVLGYDNDGNYLGVIYDGYANSFTISLAGCTKAYIYTGSAYGGSYNSDIQICLNSYVDKTIYHPHFKSTLTLPEPVTLPSAGSVADTDDLCVEVSEGVFRRRQTQRIEGVDLGTDVSFQYDSSANRFYSTSLSATIGGETGSGRYKNTMLGSGIYELSMTGADKTYFVYASNKILYIYDNSKTASDLVSGKAPWLVGIKLYYELADPVVTLLDPILDNFVLTEAGGTITPRQTQTHKIDTSFDIEYFAL